MTQASVTSPACVFCDALAQIDEESLIVHRGRQAYVILNKFPYNNGHAMVVPHRHAARLVELDGNELSEVMALTQLTERVLTDVYAPHAFNMGLNVGRSAGAGVLDHIHMHVVPRWNGDTSFMTVLGETRVLPEDMSVTVGRLRAAFGAAVSR